VAVDSVNIDGKFTCRRGILTDWKITRNSVIMSAIGVSTHEGISAAGIFKYSSREPHNERLFNIFLIAVIFRSRHDMTADIFQQTPSSTMKEVDCVQEASNSETIHPDVVYVNIICRLRVGLID